MEAPAALIAGCTSDAGKSVLVAGMCRLLARRGVKVAPFKAQNMSNNCAVTLDGGEIGRAQALQALACGLEPDVAFNPVLLKPGSDHTSQVVIKGRASGQVSAQTYRQRRRALRGVVAETLAQLRSRFDVVLCEGAGSPAEVNLRDSDIANMGLAQLAGLPVIVAGDIDRGGVLAHFVGTHAILNERDRARIRGFVVNKFRGDASLLTPGLDAVFEHTGVPVIGVVPFIPGLWIDAEDSLGTVAGNSVGPANPPIGSESLTVAAIRLPRVSNATDIEALACEPGVHVQWTTDPSAVERADLVVLPGSKSTVADLAWLRSKGLAEVLSRRADRGLPLMGICGGFQILCTTIVDAVESSSGTVRGLGVFDIDIEFAPEKTLVRHADGSYEVHNGQVVRSTEEPFITVGEPEGARRGMVIGTHRHGYLENDSARRQLLSDVACAAGRDGFQVSSSTSFAEERMRQLDLLADAVEEHLAGPELARATGIDQLS